MKIKTSRSKQRQHGQPSSPGNQQPRAGWRLPKWLVGLVCIALVAGASFVAFELLLPGKIPPELVGEWRVVGGQMDGTIFEFQRNGAMIGKKTIDGKPHIIEGTADGTGQMLSTTTTNPLTQRAETGTQTIVTLTKTEFVTEDPKGTRIRMVR